jgi:hypothetical protein
MKNLRLSLEVINVDGFKTKFIKEMNSFSQNLIGFHKPLRAGEEYAEKVIPAYKIKNSESIRYVPILK